MTVPKKREPVVSIERLLHEGEEVEITKRRRTIARLASERKRSAKKVRDFLARSRSIYRDKALAVSGTDLLAEDRGRY
jgi:antitoxin (DNA-binding transcriptional repressor) of toxin-antitoxin stability system